ncbi:MAG: LysM peptidoglycan-binding domain-containing protein [Bacilli bacterium]|nr:LysM peptidoglycan-binding domain-containing protein [Bacilli bacterium]MDD4283108.1 LysM peptidoglycan-binding domain-containing protein [Bacilli bacterium]MDD4718750.1 LysM peptidoglycan-binding domain-containing protein [Bacilli bacterium]
MKNYTVVPGDTLWGIARKHGIQIDKLLDVNTQITNPSFIIPGQTINIPNNNASTYTIMKGDTLWQIAKKHEIGLNNLLDANPQIINPSFIIPGQTINIPSAPSVPGTPSNQRSLEEEVIRLVNIERERVGRSPLTENPKISNLARTKSQDFINNDYFAHNSPTYGTPFNMLRSFGISFSAAAENIASGQRTAADVMNSWMNSSGHRSNILNPTYNQIGVGVARDNNGNLYWTQMFIRG